MKSMNSERTFSSPLWMYYSTVFVLTKSEWILELTFLDRNQNETLNWTSLLENRMNSWTELLLNWTSWIGNRMDSWTEFLNRKQKELMDRSFLNRKQNELSDWSLESRKEWTLELISWIKTEWTPELIFLNRKLSMDWTFESKSKCSLGMYFLNLTLGLDYLHRNQKELLRWVTLEFGMNPWLSWIELLTWTSWLEFE